uniref:Uncharacterized protein n=1 Tax=Anguilla anguilla TaxID=7936 RepID=A0A0E9W9L9_ANGAN
MLRLFSCCFCACRFHSEVTFAFNNVQTCSVLLNCQ